MEKVNSFIFNLRDDLKSNYFLLYDFDLIFSSNQLQVDLLNNTASNFFVRVNGMYSTHFFLSISRMVDPAEQFGHKNLSLYGLLDFAKEIGYINYTQLRKKVDDIKFEAETDKITLARSKYIAHRDVNYKEISGISVEFEKIKQTFDKMGDCINDVLDFLGKPKEPWSVFMTDDRYGAKALLHCLKDAMIYREVQVQRKDQSMTIEEASKCKFGELQFRTTIY